MVRTCGGETPPLGTVIVIEAIAVDCETMLTILLEQNIYSLFVESNIFLVANFLLLSNPASQLCKLL